MKENLFILLAILIAIFSYLYNFGESAPLNKSDYQKIKQNIGKYLFSNEENPKETADSVNIHLNRFTFTEYKMGTYFTIILYAQNERSASKASKEAYNKMDELNLILSDYLESSEINKLSAGSGQGNFIKVSKPLFEVIEKSLFISENSNGAFDITVGPYVKLWRRAIRQQKLPSGEALSLAKAAVGYNNIILEKNKEEVKLLVAGMQLDVGGIAKGYILDEAMKVLKSNGIKSALIDGGGDILVSEAPPGKEAWIMELNTGNDLQEPKYIIKLHNASVATSGDNYRFVEFEGKKYSHIIDPKTGYGLIDQYTVSVVAKDGATADAIASAVSILGPEEGIKMTNKIEGAAAFIFSGEKQGSKTWHSENFSQYLAVDDLGAEE